MLSLPCFCQHSNYSWNPRKTRLEAKTLGLYFSRPESTITLL